MARFLKNREKVKGQSPGALIFVGTQKVDTVNMRLIDYDENTLNEKELMAAILSKGPKFPKKCQSTKIQSDVS